MPDTHTPQPADAAPVATNSSSPASPRADGTLRIDTLLADLAVGVLVVHSGNHIAQIAQIAQIAWCNSAEARLLGGTAGELAGRYLRDIACDAADEALRPISAADLPWARVLATGQPVHQQLIGWWLAELQERRWLLVDAEPVPSADGAIQAVVCTLSDITMRYQREQLLRQSERRYRDASLAAQRHARDLALLDQTRNALADNVDAPAILSAIVDIVAQNFGYTLIGLYVVQGEELVLHRQVGYREVLERLPLTRGVMGRVARTRQAALVEDVSRDKDYIGQIAAVTSEVAVPIVVDGGVFAILNLESFGAQRLGAADLRLMETFAGHVAIALERAHVYATLRRTVSETLLVNRVREATALARDMHSILQTLCAEIGAYFHF
ncbi:MAG TPA: GAF domain-containing protein, partial [Roseiflexaceae bacterium]|nr:GAF domain-containing protein [Roseiflexaceae bacterium]